MSTHRHQGYDIVVITQSPRLLNATVKSLCGKHIHLYRAFGMEGATVYEWQHQVENPNSRVEQLRAILSNFRSAITATIKARSNTPTNCIFRRN